jgi:hypothetical protein
MSITPVLVLRIPEAFCWRFVAPVLVAGELCTRLALAAN